MSSNPSQPRSLAPDQFQVGGWTVLPRQFVLIVPNIKLTSMCLAFAMQCSQNHSHPLPMIRKTRMYLRLKFLTPGSERPIKALLPHGLLRVPDYLEFRQSWQAVKQGHPTRLRSMEHVRAHIALVQGRNSFQNGRHLLPRSSPVAFALLQKSVIFRQSSLKNHQNFLSPQSPPPRYE